MANTTRRVDVKVPPKPLSSGQTYQDGPVLHDVAGNLNGSLYDLPDAIQSFLSEPSANEPLFDGVPGITGSFQAVAPVGYGGLTAEDLGMGQQAFADLERQQQDWEDKVAAVLESGEGSYSRTNPMMQAQMEVAALRMQHPEISNDRWAAMLRDQSAYNTAIEKGEQYPKTSPYNQLFGYGALKVESLPAGFLQTADGDLSSLGVVQTPQELLDQGVSYKGGAPDMFKPR